MKIDRRLTMATAILDIPATETSDMPKPSTSTRPPAVTLPAVDRVVLTGFMGSGKSTIGPVLAELLSWRFLDLDSEIERRDGRSVARIFAESGEPHFRKLESAALATLLGRRRVVLALGGGAPEELGNRLLLEQTPRTAVVYLAAPFEALVTRCLQQPGAAERPVLADFSAAERRFKARRRLYERIAAHTVETTQLSVEQTATLVLKCLAAQPG
jgi:shikimate kinase